MKQLNRTAALFVLGLSSVAAIAQSPNPAPTPAPTPLVGSIAGHPGWPTAKPEDVSSPEAILAAVYNVISGPKGHPRDWDRMRSLFLPDARLIPATNVPAGPGATLQPYAVVDQPTTVVPGGGHGVRVGRVGY